MLTEIYHIPGFLGGGYPVLAENNETFIIETYRHRLTFKDEDLKPIDGKVIINIKELDLGQFFAYNIPDEFEMPAEILQRRACWRKEKKLAKDALFIDRSVDPIRYFYLEGDKLRILQGENEAVATKIEVIHGQKVVLISALELGHPYLKLPAEVADKFGSILWEKEIKKLALVHVGQNQLNGREYYRLNMDISSNMWSRVGGYFECFGTDGELQGWLTCEPDRVSEMLGILIQGL